MLLFASLYKLYIENIKNFSTVYAKRYMLSTILTQLAQKFELMEIEDAKSNPLCVLHHFLTYNSTFLF